MVCFYIVIIIALLPETTIRDLNDEINKQLKEKFFWEKQILDLGGPNYIQESKKLEASEKKYQIGNYKYFGAARQLPGVKELFDEEDIKVFLFLYIYHLYSLKDEVDMICTSVYLVIIMDIVMKMMELY